MTPRPVKHAWRGVSSSVGCATGSVNRPRSHASSFHTIHVTVIVITAVQRRHGDTRHRIITRWEDVMRRTTELRVKLQIWRELDSLLAQRSALGSLRKRGEADTRSAAAR